AGAGLAAVVGDPATARRQLARLHLDTGGLRAAARAGDPPGGRPLREDARGRDHLAGRVLPGPLRLRAIRQLVPVVLDRVARRAVRLDDRDDGEVRAVAGVLHGHVRGRRVRAAFEADTRTLSGVGDAVDARARGRTRAQQIRDAARERQRVGDIATVAADI